MPICDHVYLCSRVESSWRAKLEEVKEYFDDLVVDDVGDEDLLCVVYIAYWKKIANKKLTWVWMRDQHWW